MTTYKMADELIYQCTKCKLNLNHRIILLDAGQPKRVLCLTCKTDRMYRPAKKSSSTRSTTVKRTSSTKSSKASKNNLEAKWLAQLESDTDVDAKKYHMDSSYEVGDRIKHPTFGLGLVVQGVSDDNVRIFFKNEGVKILKCGR